MKTILLFGAGKSSTVLIEYLLENAVGGNWQLTVVDANLELAETKIGNAVSGRAVSFDINNERERAEHIDEADLVISMLPPALHILVARDCLRFGKHLLTASYVNGEIEKLADDIRERGLLFICEMGLDPGIDHMSAMAMIDGIRDRGGKIRSFKSHCGGLVAPESDDNPWHYKISWNPRNIVLAGKNGAHYREAGQEVRIEYEKLFSTDNLVEVPRHGVYGWYANRDSISYMPLYGLQDCDTFIRTTLRHADFMYGWKNIIDLKLTDEIPRYHSDGKSLSALFKEHLDQQDFGKWIERKMKERFEATQNMLNNLTRLMEAEEEAQQVGENVPESFIAADSEGELEEIRVDDVKTRAAAFVANRLHEANLTLKQLLFLGLDDKETIVNKGLCSAADILQFAAERKLALAPGDRDMVVMMHEIGYETEGKSHELKSSLVVTGEDHLHTAMARTVGLPLGIAAKLILAGKLDLTGLHIPTKKEIYEPVLVELAANGIVFHESE